MRFASSVALQAVVTAQMANTLGNCSIASCRHSDIRQYSVCRTVRDVPRHKKVCHLSLEVGETGGTQAGKGGEEKGSVDVASWSGSESGTGGLSPRGLSAAAGY